jgi:HEAT repeat protein
MISLAQIQDPAAFGTASSLLNSPDPLIRDAAQRLVASVPAQADPLIKTLLRDDREGGVRTALRLLALIGTPDALGQIGPYLDDPRPAIRIVALQGLARRCPPDRRAAFMALKDDPFPTVRRVARGLEPTP